MSQTLQSGHAGMGMSKHRKSGISPKSPKTRFLMKLEAEKNEKKRPPSTCIYSSVREALNNSN